MSENVTKNPFTGEYLENGKINLVKLLADCPARFNKMTNNFRTYVIFFISYKGLSTKWNWKTKNENLKLEQFSVLNQILLELRKFPFRSDNTKKADILSVTAWMLSAMLSNSPAFIVREKA